MLASASPRRARILRDLGVAFRVVVSNEDESLRPGEVLVRASGGTPASPLDRSKAKFSLIGSVLSRSKLTPEQVEILKLDPLGTYKAVSEAITQELFGSDA